MGAKSLQQYRDKSEIVADLERLCQEDGYIYTLCHLIFSDMPWVDEVADPINWSEHLNQNEFSFLLGLMVKRPFRYKVVPSKGTVEEQFKKTFDLFAELLGAHIRAFGNSRETRDLLLESIFYGGDGAYDFQFPELAEIRYTKDQKWLESHLGVPFTCVIDIAKCLRQLIQNRFQEMFSVETFEDSCKKLLSIFTFTPQDIRGFQEDHVQNFLKAFSCNPGVENQEFSAPGAYNKVVSHPLIHLANNQYFLPIPYNLAHSIYESPFYWMLEDPSYSENGFENRGDATEQIGYELLKEALGKQRVFRGVKVSKGKKDTSDIDVLALAGNKAVIVQAKSKKLTEVSRMGDLEKLNLDFEEAVQEAYDQGLVCRKAILERGNTLKDDKGQTIKLHEAIDDAYIVCLTADHYPAVNIQLDAFLRKKNGDPYPLAMSVFDLDIVTFYLNDPFELLYYLRQRSTHAGHFKADSEMAYLGFHFREKLFRIEEKSPKPIPQYFAHFVDVDFPTAKGHYPKTEASSNLFPQWSSDEFNQLVDDLKVAGDPKFTDALFLLYDLAGTDSEKIVELIRDRKLAALRSGRPNDASLLYSQGKRGVTIMGYPQASPYIAREFLRLAKAAKYRRKANEWLALGARSDSPKLVDIYYYSKEPWHYDAELERLERFALKQGTMVKSDSQKIGRNDPCFCGSGLKYKRCHGR